MEREILTVSVSQLNNYIKRVLDANSYLSDIFVKGEISNFKLHSSGHIYASLKDEGALIKMVMFKGSVQNLKVMPENGMRVICRGRISVYERDGVYQLYCEDIVPDGVGSLYAAFEKLKAKLETEGLFDEIYKKPLPRFPQRIGIVTAKTGAAVRDMINVSKRRFPLAELVLVPVSVQGISAAPEIAKAIQMLNRHKACDVMIVGRGGGSIEDLWAFNEEIVARAIFDSDIPVVSAVGHETDFTIADFVADLRAPTPSAAAEVVCPSGEELKKSLLQRQERLSDSLIHFLEMKKNRLERLKESYAFTHFPDRLFEYKQFVDTLLKRSADAILKSVTEKRMELSGFAGKLDALSPLKTLARGYSIALKEDGTLISSVKDAKNGESFTLKLKDGTKNATFQS